MTFALDDFWCKVLRSATKCPCPGGGKKKQNKTRSLTRSEKAVMMLSSSPGIEGEIWKLRTSWLQETSVRSIFLTALASIYSVICCFEIINSSFYPGSNRPLGLLLTGPEDCKIVGHQERFLFRKGRREE